MWFMPGAVRALQILKQILEKDNMIKLGLIHNEEVKTVTVHFEHSVLDKVKNLFRSKAKRFPAVATFSGFDAVMHTPMGLTVRWGNNQYFYPAHVLRRVKLSK